MTPSLLYTLAGMALFALALHGFLVRRHLIRRIVALNIMGSGVFLVFLGMAARGDGPADPVPQALVITGIVVAVAATALALALLLRMFGETGQLTIETPPKPDKG
jgi:multicomponent Na+:H+ antiporter subunit C